MKSYYTAKIITHAFKKANATCLQKHIKIVIHFFNSNRCIKNGNDFLPPLGEAQDRFTGKTKLKFKCIHNPTLSEPL